MGFVQVCQRIFSGNRDCAEGTPHLAEENGTGRSMTAKRLEYNIGSGYDEQMCDVELC